MKNKNKLRDALSWISLIIELAALLASAALSLAESITENHNLHNPAWICLVVGAAYGLAYAVFRRIAFPDKKEEPEPQPEPSPENKNKTDADPDAAKTLEYVSSGCGFKAKRLRRVPEDRVLSADHVMILPKDPRYGEAVEALHGIVPRVKGVAIELEMFSDGVAVSSSKIIADKFCGGINAGTEPTDKIVLEKQKGFAEAYLKIADLADPENAGRHVICEDDRRMLFVVMKTGASGEGPRFGIIVNCYVAPSKAYSYAISGGVEVIVECDDDGKVVSEYIDGDYDQALDRICLKGFCYDIYDDPLISMLLRSKSKCNGDKAAAIKDIDAALRGCVAKTLRDDQIKADSILKPAAEGDKDGK